MDDETELPADPNGEAPQDPARSLRSRVADGAEAVAEAVADAGGALAERLRPAAEHVIAAVDHAREPRPANRPVKGRRKRARTPLPNLFEVHPEARSAPTREVGLIALPVDEIIGTAVDGPSQRGLDFLPLPALKSLNWEARWQRIRAATDRLSILPPIEVVKTAEGYWVVDGHNRVAAARATGQVAIDAVVRSVRLPGEPSVRPTGSLAPLLEGSGELRAAASGRFSPGAGLDTVVDDHEHEPPSGDPEPPATGSEAPESDT
ncbi:MAG TPA: hypothetical protein VFC71_00770 [Candidatus Polarisedimenticolia bacterium]|nr:hypothetical protein [Candidatus Polarisedimenticolia bacterium]